MNCYGIIGLIDVIRLQFRSKKTTTLHLQYIWIILHYNHSYSSAVPSISYDPAEDKRIFFTHETASV